MRTTIGGVLTEIPGYRVSTDGRVCTCWFQAGFGTKWVMGDEWFQLAARPNKQGYREVKSGFKGKGYTRLLHRIVLESWVGQCPQGHETRHFPDPNPANCRLENLSWTTSRQNKADRVTHVTHFQGVQIPSAKLDDEKVRTIWGLLRKGETRGEIARKFGLAAPTIRDIARGRTWKHVTRSLPQINTT
jgi:hypothetical protein